MKFIPSIDGSLWRVETGFNGGNIRRVYQCPSGYTMSRNELYPTDDTCVQCGIGEYLLSPIIIENKSIACLKCPIGGICPGQFFPSSEMQTVLKSPETNFDLILITGGAVVTAQAEYWRRYEASLKYSTMNSSLAQFKAVLYKCPPGVCSG